MAGKVALITGCNTGIGKETARELHAKGFEVVFACRSKEKAQEAIADIAAASSAADKDKRLVFLEPLDTSNLASVKAFCEKFKQAYTRLDALVLNAGTGYVKREDRITKDGFEAVFQINYLSHFLLCVSLAQLLQKTEGARVVALTSLEHRTGNAVCDWDNLARKSTTARSYPSSKLAAIFLVYELQRRSGLRTAAVNPGYVGSDIWRYLRGWKVKFQQLANTTVALTTKQGCQTSVWAATSESLPAGPVYVSPYKVYDCCPILWDAVGPFRGPEPCNSSKLSYDTKEAAKLWDFSMKAVEKDLPSDVPKALRT